MPASRSSPSSLALWSFTWLLCALITSTASSQPVQLCVANRTGEFLRRHARRRRPACSLVRRAASLRFIASHNHHHPAAEFTRSRVLLDLVQRPSCVCQLCSCAVSAAPNSTPPTTCDLQHHHPSLNLTAGINYIAGSSLMQTAQVFMQPLVRLRVAAACACNNSTTVARGGHQQHAEGSVAAHAADERAGGGPCSLLAFETTVELWLASSSACPASMTVLEPFELLHAEASAASDGADAEQPSLVFPLQLSASGDGGIATQTAAATSRLVAEPNDGSLIWQAGWDVAAQSTCTAAAAPALQGRSAAGGLTAWLLRVIVCAATASGCALVLKRGVLAGLQ
jgi:hypothetical protein